MSDIRRFNKPYPGDSPQKRIARAITYYKLRHLWSVTGKPPGKIIVLAGDNAAELNVLRHFLKCDPEDAVFVDHRTTTGLLRVVSQWPKAYAIKADVLDVLQRIGEPIAFINLDFMGHWEVGKTEKVLSKISDRLEPRGTLAFTFTRGRESDHVTRHWKLLKAHAIAQSKLSGEPFTNDRLLVRDQIRFRGYEHLIKAHLGTDTELVGTLKYARRQEREHIAGYSIGIQLFQRMPPSLKTQKWHNTVNRTLFKEEENGGRIDTVGATARLRELVLWGIKQGMSSKELGGLLDLNPKTIGAYRANVTRRA